ncbi:B-box zinc finger protein 32 [Cajanus cajan]|nr:B-box zinc finger protein 32 [Cajanus cajan]
MAPYEALYGRRCRTPLCWYQEATIKEFLELIFGQTKQRTSFPYLGEEIRAPGREERKRKTKESLNEQGRARENSENQLAKSKLTQHSYLEISRKREEASLYCPSDSAFLCSDCDAAVHAANFLVARHLRRLLCCKCDRFAGIHISGASSRRLPSTCGWCSAENPSCSSTRVSSSEKKTRPAEKRKSCGRSEAAEKRRRNVGWEAAEEVLEKWSRELGLGLGENGNRVASHALNVCLEKWRCLPLRVAAATSFWLGMRFCGDGGLATCQNLARLEAKSGVPAKLIVAAHANLSRVLAQRRALQEGWGES